MLKAIIFDFDYTLGDSTEGIVESANYAFEKLGYDRHTKEQIRKTIGLSLKESFYLLQPEGNCREAEQFQKYFVEKADDVMVANTVLYDGVKELLEKWKQDGYQIGIVTTKYRYRISDIFKKFHAGDLLDFIVGGDDVSEKKPDPEGIFLALKKFHCDKSQILYIGDSIVDAKTAQNAQVDFAAVLTGTTSKEEFEAFPYVMIGKDIQDVNRYMENCNA